MSDINYDPSICRNIMVDIRYVLFIIDKFAEAKHLIKEMNLQRRTKDLAGHRRKNIEQGAKKYEFRKGFESLQFASFFI